MTMIIVLTMVMVFGYTTEAICKGDVAVQCHEIGTMFSYDVKTFCKVKECYAMADCSEDFKKATKVVKTILRELPDVNDNDIKKLFTACSTSTIQASIVIAIAMATMSLLTN